MTNATSRRGATRRDRDAAFHLLWSVRLGYGECQGGGGKCQGHGQGVSSQSGYHFLTINIKKIENSEPTKPKRKRPNPVEAE